MNYDKIRQTIVSMTGITPKAALILRKSGDDPTLKEIQELLKPWPFCLGKWTWDPGTAVLTYQANDLLPTHTLLFKRLSASCAIPVENVSTVILDDSPQQSGTPKPGAVYNCGPTPSNGYSPGLITITTEEWLKLKAAASQNESVLAGYRAHIDVLKEDKQSLRNQRDKAINELKNTEARLNDREAINRSLELELRDALKKYAQEQKDLASIRELYLQEVERNSALEDAEVIQNPPIPGPLGSVEIANIRAMLHAWQKAGRP